MPSGGCRMRGTSYVGRRLTGACGIGPWTVGGAVAIAAGPVLGALLTTRWSCPRR